MNSDRNTILELAAKAKEAARYGAALTTPQKNKVLNEMAQALSAGRERIQVENRKDLDGAKDKGLSSAMIDRLVLNAPRIEEMAKGLREVAALPDPVGEVVKGWTRPNGLRVEKVRIPL